LVPKLVQLRKILSHQIIANPYPRAVFLSFQSPAKEEVGSNLNY